MNFRLVLRDRGSLEAGRIGCWGMSVMDRSSECEGQVVFAMHGVVYIKVEGLDACIKIERIAFT